MSTLRVLVLGDHKVGKSAVTVRFLTKRFIGEYYSDTDHVYRYTLRQEDICTDVEVCDTCSKPCPSNMEETKILQADALVVVYSVCSRRSFITASNLLRTIGRLRPSSSSSSTSSSAQLQPPTLLLGNMTDLEHLRQVGEDEGRGLSSAHGCQHYEVSAADSALSVDAAFGAFLRQARSVVQNLVALKRRRSSLGRRIGGLFSKAALGSSSSSSSCKGTWAGSNGNRTVDLGRSHSVSDNMKSLSLSSSSNNSNLGSSGHGKAALRRFSSSGDTDRPASGILPSSSSSKDKDKEANNKGNGDRMDMKLVSVLNRDNHYSSTSPFSSSTLFSPSYASTSTGSDVCIANALRKRAPLVVTNNNKNNVQSLSSENCDKRKMSLPTLPEEIAMKTVSESSDQTFK